MTIMRKKNERQDKNKKKIRASAKRPHQSKARDEGCVIAEVVLTERSCCCEDECCCRL